MCKFPIKLKLLNSQEQKGHHKLVESDEDNSIKKPIVEEKEITWRIKDNQVLLQRLLLDDIIQ